MWYHAISAEISSAHIQTRLMFKNKVHYSEKFTKNKLEP